ncbi:Transcriptional regulator, AraC family protein [Enhygromyxa salina]|uniref:Transcriptional regulator, AraC family protein n=1 Tax=Enhygromyxa salina TaxID=215803 RepID=A0A0C2CQF6_9BACT|nr:AraC family transcriptional regulator [Enhygromyxa salina]KIG11950.1 Transcriptional regulator, AraC family protein [Enhygromyxa salina]
MTGEDEDLAGAIRAVAGHVGLTPTAIPKVACIRSASTGALKNQTWRACLAVVAEGTKELVLGGATYRLSPGHWTLTPVPLPLTSRIAAAPFSGVLVELELVSLARLVAEMDRRDEEVGELPPGIFVGRLDEGMRCAVNRLAGLMAAEEAGRVLGEGRVRELLFHLLRSPMGPAIRRFVRAGGAAHRICEAAHHIEARLDQAIDVEGLAATAHMSRTVFYEQFKRVTSLSPLQYQKRLRLLQAQRLMVDEQTTAEDAAYRVGYQSPSHFSRDYIRLFGEPPYRNALRLREAAIVS